MANPHGSFIWYALMTTDPEAASAFYSDVVGWSIGGFGGAALTGPDDYRILTAPDGEGAGGIARIPAGAPTTPGWFGYVGVDDVDATAAAVEAAGGKVLVPPQTLEGVGRLATAADPQRVPFHIMRGSSPGDSHAFHPNSPGHCAWHELHTSDWEGAFAFYETLFGWVKGTAMDMGPMGTYQLFGLSAEISFGGMMNSPNMPRPTWLYYFTVDAIDPAMERIKAGGGTIAHGPHEVPGGSYMVQAFDPQGALFAVVGPR